MKRDIRRRCCREGSPINSQNRTYDAKTILAKSMVELQVEQGDQVSGWISLLLENRDPVAMAISFNGVDLMTVLFGNQEECYIPWANGYRLGSVRWNREIINHEINVGIMYPELTHPMLPFEHLSLSTEPRNLPESARAGRLTIPIRWSSNSNQVIITDENPQTISFQQGMIAQTIEIQFTADHEYFNDTGILTFESIDLENTHIDFIGYRTPRSHPEVHLWNNNSRILRIPRDFQTDIWNQMNRWKGNGTLTTTRITLELEDGTTIRGDYQRDRSMFEFEFSMPKCI